MSQAGLTIAIPSCNDEALLPRPVLSALRAIALLRNQGVPGEILLVDDGSRDGSPTLLRQLEALYSRDHLRVVAFETGSGSAASRNQALALSRYRHIAFLDPDHELIPENLPLFLETLQETRAAAAYGNVLVRSAAADRAHNLLSNESVQGRLFEANYLDSLFVCDRLQLLDCGGFAATGGASDDHGIWQHLISNGRRVVFVPVVLGYCYALPTAPGRDGSEDSATAARLRRVFNRVGVREHLPMNSQFLRHHPRIGSL